MKKLIKISAIAITLGSAAFLLASESRMACFFEPKTTMGQDQGPLACRYHWATTVYATAKKDKKYRCYIQFKEAGIKIKSIPEIQQELKANMDMKYAGDQQAKNKIVSNATTQYIASAQSLPLQGALKIGVNKQGDPFYSLKFGSPGFIFFSNEYPQASYELLRKLNYNPGTGLLDEVKTLVNNVAIFEDFVSAVNNLDTILPCLGCPSCMPQAQQHNDLSTD